MNLAQSRTYSLRGVTIFFPYNTAIQCCTFFFFRIFVIVRHIFYFFRVNLKYCLFVRKKCCIILQTLFLHYRMSVFLQVSLTACMFVVELSYFSSTQDLLSFSSNTIENYYSSVIFTSNISVLLAGLACYFSLSLQYIHYSSTGYISCTTTAK